MNVTRTAATSHTEPPASVDHEDPVAMVAKDFNITLFLLGDIQSDQNNTSRKIGSTTALIFYFLSGFMAIEAFVVLMKFIYQEIIDSISTHPGLKEATIALNTSIIEEVTESIEPLANELVKEIMEQEGVDAVLKRLASLPKAALIVNLEDIQNGERFKAAVNAIADPAAETFTNILMEDGMKMLGIDHGRVEEEVAPADDLPAYEDMEPPETELAKLRKIRATITSALKAKCSDAKGIQADSDFIAMKDAFATSLRDSIVHALARSAATKFGVRFDVLPEDDMSVKGQFGSIASKATVNFFNVFNITQTEEQ
jgi:hypothetical protein